jgi:hypothetical protein
MSEANFGCIEAQAYLPLYVGDDLDAPAISAVRAHLERCATCAASLAALRGALAAFAPERARIDPKVDLWAGIERELAASGKLAANPAARKTAAAVLAPASVAESGAESLSVATVARAGRGPSSLRRWTYLAAAAAVVLVAWRVLDTSPATPSIDSLQSVEREIAKSAAPQTPATGPVEQGPAAPEAADRAADRAVDGALEAPWSSAGSSAVALAGDETASPAAVEPAAVDTAGSTTLAQPGGAPKAAPADGLRRLTSQEALLRELLGADRNGAYSLAGSQGLR